MSGGRQAREFVALSRTPNTSSLILLRHSPSSPLAAQESHQCTPHAPSHLQSPSRLGQRPTTTIGVAMATLSQLHLAGAATANLQPRNAASRFAGRDFSCQPSLGLIRGGAPRLCIVKPVSSRREVLAGVSDPHLIVQELVEGGDAEVAMMKEEGDGLFSGLPFKGVEILGAAAGMFLEAAGPAHAVIKDEVEEMMRFSPEAWINIYLTTGVWLVLYFVVIPLVIYNYLRLRWYKRTFAETYFQFLLVFLFFPGLLLLAPFINFRRLPNDGAEEP